MPVLHEVIPPACTEVAGGYLMEAVTTAGLVAA
jgi:hypothetical protein